ncbi:MAG TPA: hypothetical protein VMC84_13265 [Methanocella sp.]|uniref:hypothetical protein n=1 Tax=Methanocella sp. TaxID=2052833 RepID=UPI002C59E0EF|nr:hypothetical protein [Methanocella sp.]HTY92139.1 hypothetical protein [Methanocella sp.]
MCSTANSSLMQKNPYWMMLGSVAGFFIGVAAIMLATADYSIYNVFSQPPDSAALPSIQLRMLIIIVCMAAGMLAGLVATLVLSKVGPDTELPVL